MKVLLLAHFSAEATLISAADKDHERDNFSVFFSTEVRVVMCSNLRFLFFRLFAKMQARLLTEDICPTFVSDFSASHHGSGSMEGGQCTRKGKEGGYSGQKV